MAEEIVRYEDRDGAQITLTPQDVAQYCYSGNAQLTQRDVVNFMATCKALGANPYLKDVYLVKYNGSEDAQIMAGKNYYTRVAASIETYDGMTAGVVCLTQQGQVAYRTGSMAYPGDTCIGGWAEVHDKRWSVPVRCEVAMEEYNSHRSLWKTKPLTMIRKVALVQALREAYPDRFAGVYDQSEMPERPQQVQPAQAAKVESVGPSAEDIAFLKDATAQLVAAGFNEAEVKPYLWQRFQQGGRAEAEAAVAALMASAGQQAEEAAQPEPEQQAIEPDMYEDEVAF